MSDGRCAESDTSSSTVSTARAAWQHWQLAAFDPPAQADSSPADDHDLPPAEPEPDPAVVRETARQQGFDEGRRLGHEQGHAEGHAVGRDEGRQEGLASGHAEGYAAGLAAGQALARDHAERLKRLADELSQSLRDLEEDIGQGLLSLALDVARHVVGDTLAQHPEAIIASVRQVMQADPTAVAPLRLWLHPDDLTLVNGYLADDILDSDWHILTDATLSRGGCRAETAFGTIDATLETRWRRVAASLGRQSEWESKRERDQ